MANYVRFVRPDGGTASGLLEGDRIAVVSEPFWETTERTGEDFALADVRLLPPTQPRSIVCVGLNYSSHLGGQPAPDPPTLFLKPLSSIAGPGDEIRLPAASAKVDPEGEIVIVVGRELFAPTREEALAGIFGYTAGNDVSARDWQNSDGQWWRAKGADTFGVFGPSIATGLDYNAIEVRTRVNGEGEAARALGRAHPRHPRDCSLRGRCHDAHARRRHLHRYAGPAAGDHAGRHCRDRGHGCRRPAQSGRRGRLNLAREKRLSFGGAFGKVRA